MDLVQRWWIEGGGEGRGEAVYKDSINFNFILNIMFLLPRTRTVAKTRLSIKTRCWID